MFEVKLLDYEKKLGQDGIAVIDEKLYAVRVTIPAYLGMEEVSEKS